MIKFGSVYRTPTGALVTPVGCHVKGITVKVKTAGKTIIVPRKAFDKYALEERQHA